MTVSLYWWARVAAAAALFAASTPARSADVAAEPEPSNGESNWYASVQGGIKFGEEWDDDWTNGDLTFEFEDGWRIGGTVGYSLSRIFSLEGELGYMQQELERDQDCCDHGNLSIATGMVNLVAGVGDLVRPYVGAGAGLAHVSFNDVGLPAAFDLDDSDLVLAAQGLAGVDFMVLPHFAIGARYRFLHLGDLELKSDGQSTHDIDPDFIHSVEAVFTVGF